MSETVVDQGLLVPEGAHVLGDPAAPVTVVEFADLECPYCRDATPVLRDVVASSGGTVRLVLRHFPLFEVHPHALVAALAVEAAGAQGRFWEMVEELYAHQDRLADADLVAAAERAGVPDPGAVAGPAAQRWSERVRRDYGDGLAAGVEGTPTVFVGGVPLRGRVTPERVRDAVAAATARAGRPR
ncbi:disulfide bond formation protein DsbA [Xylanimonas oleitrophica]|uniref:Disulfide bond formation protein DsbA n=1 Tax=Xylanimonas oleitrophica TaxID=2607479 RepID=A0A2W5XWP5_9MICO|nr:DsbA family protein [Xylanimonas oleitrophica]PZR55018.1 disulfide bond formation protein DsbA [Xylanimonas oleitrophica]